MTNAKKIRTELSLEILTPTSIPLEAKIMEFKEDPEKMDEMIKFIDEIVENAQKQAELRVLDNKALLRKNGKDFDSFVCSTQFSCHRIFDLVEYQTQILAARKLLLNSEDIVRFDAGLDFIISRRTLLLVRDDESRGHTLLYGIKRGRIITRARSAVVRIFEAICNCTNSSPQITRQLPSDQPAAALPTN